MNWCPHTFPCLSLPCRSFLSSLVDLFYDLALQVIIYIHSELPWNGFSIKFLWEDLVLVKSNFSLLHPEVLEVNWDWPKALSYVDWSYFTFSMKNVRRFPAGLMHHCLVHISHDLLPHLSPHLFPCIGFVVPYLLPYLHLLLRIMHPCPLQWLNCLWSPKASTSFSILDPTFYHICSDWPFWILHHQYFSFIWIIPTR